MAPAVRCNLDETRTRTSPGPEKRVTRSSRRLKTPKGTTDARHQQSPAHKHESNAKIKKPNRRTSRNSKTAVTAKSKQEQKRPAAKEEEEEVASATPTTPKNVTTLTISSDLVKNSIQCHFYSPTNSNNSGTTFTLPFLFTHGAGGTLSAPAVVHFCTGFSSCSDSPILAFQGSMNLAARVKGFHACRAHVLRGVESIEPEGDLGSGLVFGGRSMGARAAVIAATESLNGIGKAGNGKAELVLVSYPLQGPKGVRDQILLELPKGVDVLFIVGDRDAMCPIELLEKVRAKMGAGSRLVVVKGADHGMNVKPASKTGEIGEETGRVAARWLKREIGREGDMVYVGEGE